MFSTADCTFCAAAAAAPPAAEDALVGDGWDQLRVVAHMYVAHPAVPIGEADAHQVYIGVARESNYGVADVVKAWQNNIRIAIARRVSAATRAQLTAAMWTAVCAAGRE